VEEKTYEITDLYEEEFNKNFNDLKYYLYNFVLFRDNNKINEKFNKEIITKNDINYLSKRKNTFYMEDIFTYKDISYNDYQKDEKIIKILNCNHQEILKIKNLFKQEEEKTIFNKLQQFNEKRNPNIDNNIDFNDLKFKTENHIILFKNNFRYFDRDQVYKNIYINDLYLNDEESFSNIENGKNDFHKLAKIFYNKRIDINGESRYLTENEFIESIRLPSYFDHHSLLQSTEFSSIKINDLLQENIFNYVSDLKSMIEILDSFSESDKFSRSFYNLEDLNHKFYIEQMILCNSYSITTNNFITQKVKMDFKKMDGKNAFTYSDLLRLNEEDKAHLFKIIFEKDIHIADGYNLNLFKNYIKPYLKWAETADRKLKNENLNKMYENNKNEKFKKKLLQSFDFKKINNIDIYLNSASEEKIFFDKKNNRKKNSSYNDYEINADIHYDKTYYTKYFKEKSDNLYENIYDYYDIEELAENGLNKQYFAFD